MSDKKPARHGIFLPPGSGRPYDMGRIVANFKADGEETNGRYSISEWWLEPNTKGPGLHCHPEDDVFFVLEGTMTFWLGDKWIDASKGSFILAPGGMKHDFENRTNQRAGALNISVPGGFEPEMPAIVEWFQENSPGNAND